MSSRRQKKVGRPPEHVSRRRDFRANMMLDDNEERVFKRTLEELSGKEGRLVQGSELLRRLCMPFLCRQARKFGVHVSPRLTDALPLSENDAP